MTGARLALLGLLAVAGFVAGCAEPAATREPTRRERAFPFTGTWNVPGERHALRLYQQDARSVTGTFGPGGLASGIVEPSGHLFLAISRDGALALYDMTSDGSGLTPNRCVSAAAGDWSSDSTTWTRQ